MYKYKNKGLSFIEITIALSLAIVISLILLSSVYPVVKSFHLIYSKHKKEKSILSFKYLVNSHLSWSKSKEIRIISSENKLALPSFSEIFSKPSEEKGNILIMKFNFYNKNDKKFEIKYRCFSFFDNKAYISYFDLYDIFALTGILKTTDIIENCNGEFFITKNGLHFIIKDLEKGQNYEIILSEK